MKKVLILSCLILFLTPMAWGQENVESPIWNVGDKWSYKRADGATFTNEVVDVKDCGNNNRGEEFILV